MRSITPLATMPFGESGDNVPASTPWPAMMAISSGGMPARPATAIAGGASNALAGVAPAPIVATTRPIAKNMMGSTPAWPRHMRTARAVSRASVPFDSAMLKSSVTPTSVTNSATGNPASTASGDIPPRKTPTRSARASDNTPTLIVVVQLKTTASVRAATETQARFNAAPCSQPPSGCARARRYRRGARSIPPSGRSRRWRPAAAPMRRTRRISRGPRRA